MRLEGKVALVTGGTRGIGAAIVQRMAEESARVAFTGRDTTRGADVEHGIRRASGGDVRFIAADSTDDDEVRRAAEHTVETFGALTTLVNNAAPTDLTGAGGHDGPVATMPVDGYRNIIRTGLDGLVFACRHAIPAIAESGGGSIVNISSGASVRGMPGVFAYTATKGAMDAVTRQMAVDYAKSNIRVNGVIVGSVDKSGEPGERLGSLANPRIRKALEGIHLTRLGRPRDIANAVLFLASDEAAFITGALLTVDGGSSINPNLPDFSKLLADD
jgi:meso-butanediol dehydrogenase / (S,S)-butanediol dehydrogenase / diacetyl reductase